MNKKASVILYTRHGCHLCEEAKAQIMAADCAESYVLEEIDIETDPDLVERYGTKIPVVAINGVDAFTYRVDAVAFKNLIVAKSGAHGVTPLRISK